MTKRTLPFHGGSLQSKILPVIAVALMASTAFVCVTADGSDADALDYEKSVYVKVDNLSLEKYSELVGSTSFLKDADYITYIFNANLTYSKYSTLDSTAENICHEQCSEETQSGMTSTSVMAKEISAQNVVLTRTVTALPSSYYAQDGYGEGFLKAMEYLGDTPYEVGSVIKCTCPSYTCISTMAMTFTYRACGDGYIQTDISYIEGTSYKAVLSYTITTGDSVKSFDIIVNYETYVDYTVSYNYTKDIPSADDKDIYQKNVKVNSICNNTSVSIRIDGNEYTLCQNLSSDDIKADLTKYSGQWYQYSGQQYRDELYDIPKDGTYQDFFSGLTGDNEADAKTITALGGKASINNISDADNFIASVKNSFDLSGSCNDYATVCIAAAVAAVIIIAILIILFWKPGLLRKNEKAPSQTEQPDHEVKE